MMFPSKDVMLILGKRIPGASALLTLGLVSCPVLAAQPLNVPVDVLSYTSIFPP